MQRGLTALQEASLRKKNLPVPALVKPESSDHETDRIVPRGEDSLQLSEQPYDKRQARESDGKAPLNSVNSRGGQTPQQKWRKKNRENLAKYMRDWRAKTK